MNEHKTCSRCGEVKPATREFFGSTPSGGLRGYCRTCMNKRSREYELRNKDKRQIRDAKRAKAGGGTRRSFDKLTKRELHNKQNGICSFCLTPIEAADEAEVDHLTPLSRGGADNQTNLVLAHARCNKEKHNKTINEHWEWRVKVGLSEENLWAKLSRATKN